MVDIMEIMLYPDEANPFKAATGRNRPPELGSLLTSCDNFT